MSDSPLRTRLRALVRSREGVLLCRLAVVLAVYTAVRAAFFVEHRAQFAGVPVLEVLGAFARGVRFDVSAIVYTNLPFILLSLAPLAIQARRGYQRMLFGTFVAVNGALVLIMVADVGYYPFTGTRVTREVFAVADDASAQAVQLLSNFPGLTTVALMLTAALVVFYPRGWASEARPRRWPHAAFLGLAVVAFAVVGARGGLQKKPLKPIHAFAAGQHEIGILTLNTAFTLIHSSRNRPLEPVHYFDDEREVERMLRAPYGYAERAGGGAPPEPQNVVLLILESFGTEFWGGEGREIDGLTPFLDSLSGHGTLLTNSFANGRRSMDALPSLLLGVPLYTGPSIAVSEYQGNQWRGLGHFLGEAGYHTSMFHGAPKGTMYFDAIAAMSGIEDFYPLERFPATMRAEDSDGDWGLFDEPALQFVATELTQHAEPWFSVAFTISTHHPYIVPEAYRDTLPTGSKDIHQSVAYVDHAVRRFFETARTQPWFENTLFVITGDHTAPERSKRYDTALGRYMVPVLLYHPTERLPEVDPGRITQHVDVFATVLDYTGVRPARVPRFGRSVFAAAPGEAVLATDDTFWMVRAEGVLERSPQGDERVLAYEAEATGREPGEVSPDVADVMSRRLRAHIQHYVMSLIDNSFYRDPVVGLEVRGGV